MTTEKISKIIKRVVLVIFIIAIIVAGILGIVFFQNLLPVDANAKDTVQFVVQSGWGKSKIAEELKKSNLIRNDMVFKIYLKLNETGVFMAGTYNLSPSMSVEEIIAELQKGNTLENETLTVTFIEGKRFPYYISKIASTFGYSEEEIYNVVNNEEFLKQLIADNWFITEEILDKDIYYPLEGYLFPDTYEFKKNATIEDIIKRLIAEMGTRLKVYQEEINVSKYSVHDLLTMASMVELEAVTPEDRLELAGVFYNRLKDSWTLGSDVTTAYAVKKEDATKLTTSDLAVCNAYNTRGTCVQGLPVGPICSPSYSSITAAINPNTTKYYYFVADKNGKIYFGVTEQDHLNNIRDLKNNNLWLK